MCFLSRSSFNLDSFVAVIEDKAKSRDFLSDVQVPETVRVPAAHRRQIKCVVKSKCDGDQPRLTIDEEELEFLETVTTLRRGRTNHVYVDVLNKSAVEKTLSKGSVMGSIHGVSAVVPMLRSRWTEDRIVETVAGAVSAERTDDDTWVPPADLSHLDERQKDMVMKVLKEERDVFSRTDTEIGDIKNFHKKIKLGFLTSFFTAWFPLYFVLE